MPNTTGQGITYPVSTDTVHITDDLATLALSVDAQLSADRTLRDAAWTAFTPTIAGSTSGGSLGNAGVNCRYKQYGRLVVAKYKIVWGSTSSPGVGSLVIGLPVQAQTQIDNHVGTALVIDANGGRYPGCACELNNNNDFITVTGAGNGVATAAGGLLGATTPFTWATSDEFRALIEYEAATA